MNRTAAMSFLTEQYRELSVDAKFTPQQTTDAYNSAIDMSLRYLSVDEANLATADVEQSKIITYIALLGYFALKRFSILLSIRFDVQLPGPMEAKRQGAFSSVMKLLQIAETELVNLGISIGAGSANAMQVGWFTLDYLEPGCSGGEF